MILKLKDDYDEKRKRGYQMTVDKIKCDPRYAGGLRVRVVNEWARPQWFSIAWFIDTRELGQFLKEAA